MYMLFYVPKISLADLHIRPPAGEVRRWKAHARRAGMSLTDYVRQQCNMGIPPKTVVPAAVSGDQVELPLENGRAR